MEAVFKLTRAEVEEACAQYLMQRDVRFARTPKLADNVGQDFEHLFFTGEIALVAAPKPAARLEKVIPSQDLVDLTKVVEAETAPTPAAPVVSRTSADTPRFVESKLDFNGGGGPAPAGKTSLGALLSPDAPTSTIKLPESAIAFRAES